jgi:hypothetical protein
MASAVLVAALLACGGSRTDGKPADQAGPSAEGTHASEAAGDQVDDESPPPPIDASTAMSEAAARAFLSDRFRRAGFRIRYDVRVRVDGVFDITFDGFDPDKQVGFEYIDAIERDTDVLDAERSALESSTDYRVFVIDAVDPAVLTASAEMFLSMIEHD